MKRRMVSVLVCTAVMSSFMMGCQSNEEAKSEKEHYKFGFTEMSAGSFFDACYEGLESEIKKNGDEVIHVEGKADSNYQMGVVEDFIAQDVDLVFYNPADAAASAPAMKALKEAGIPVVNFDSAVSDLEDVDAFVSTDSAGAGKAAGEELVKNHPDGGKIAILDFPKSEAAQERVKGFKEAIDGKGFEIVAQQDAGAKPEKGLSVTQDILQANDDLIAVFCINDECAQGAYSAIKAAGEDVEVYSVNGGPEAKSAMKEDGEEGIWKATGAQCPIEIGEESAKVAYKILKGEDFEKEIYIESFAITPANIEEYGKTDWQ